MSSTFSFGALVTRTVAAFAILGSALVVAEIHQEADPVRAEAPPALSGGTAMVIDMGVTSPLTIATQLKPYGLVYELVRPSPSTGRLPIPVLWVIGANKPAKGTATAITDVPDVTINGTSYKGGPFVIPPEYYSRALPIVVKWRNLGVKVDEVPLAHGEKLDLPVYQEITSWPNAVLDLQNGSIAAKYYVDAGIPTTAYRLGLPSSLTPCDDIYVMPHADPTWATHKALVPFIEAGGYFWAGCHAVSVIENLDDPADADLAPDLNLLSTNGALPYGSHGNGSPPYRYPTSASQPVLQFLGDIDDATLNGSEQIYMPKNGSAWRPTTEVLALDPDNADVTAKKSPGAASPFLYGPAFGDPGNGYVLYEGGHSLAKSTGADNIAAVRAFLNFHLLAGGMNAPRVDLQMDETAEVDEPITATATVSGDSGPFTYSWESTCDGTFSSKTGVISDGGEVTTTFTPSAVGTGCSVRLIVTDTCARVNFAAVALDVFQASDIAVEKTTEATSVAPGDTLTYTLTATAQGPGPSYGVQLTDRLPDGLAVTDVTAPEGVVCTSASGEVRCDIGTLAAGASVAVVVEVLVLESAPSALVNTARVTQIGPDTDSGNDTAGTTVSVIEPGLVVTKSADKTVIGPDDEVTYTYTVENAGTTPLSDVTVTDDKCSPVSGPSGDTANAGKLDPDETWTYTCTAKLSETTTNIVIVTAIDSGGTERSATAEETVRVVSPGLSISKTPDSQVVRAGGTAEFIIEVENTGDADLTDVVVADPQAPLCARTVEILPAKTSDSWACEMTGVTVGFTNTATVTAANPTGGATLTGSDTAAVSVGPALTITKVDDVADGTVVRPGGSYGYTITVTNNSDVTQENITLADTLPDGLTAGAVTVTAPGTSPSGVVAAQTSWTSGSFAKTPSSAWLDANWTEIGESDGASAGEVRVTGGTPVLEMKNTTGTYGASNRVDLSAYDPDHVWLRFECGDFTLATNDQLVVSAGSDSGSAAILETYTSTDQCATGTSQFNLLQIPAAHVSANTTIGFTKVPKPGTTASGVGVTIGRIGVLAGVVATETFDSGYSGGTGWLASSWTETETNGEDHLKVTSRRLFYDAAKDKPSTLSRTVSLPSDTYSNVKMWFDCRHNKFDKVPDYFRVKTGSTVHYQALDDSTPTPGCGGPQPALVGPYSVTETGTVTTLLEFNTETKEIFVDNIVFTADSTGTRTVTGGPAATPLSANGPYDLAPGESLSVTFSVTADSASNLPDGVTEFANLVGVRSTQQLTPSYATSSTPLLNPGLTITKDVDRTAIAAGEEVTYTVVVANSGNSALTLPTPGNRLSLVSDNQCTLAYVEGDIDDDEVLDVAESWTFTCTETPTADVTNIAMATAKDAAGQLVGPVSDTAVVDVSVNAIAVTLVDDAVVVPKGSPAAFRYEVTNPGEVPVYAVDVTDPYCAPVEYLGGDTNGDGALDIDETWEFSCITDAETDTDPDRTVTATAVGPTGVELEATDTGTVDVFTPGLSVTKTASSPTITKGDEVTFTVDVTNTGDANLTNPDVADSLCTLTREEDAPGNADDVLEVGETWRYTCTMTPSTEVTNTATATFTDPVGGSITGSDSATVTVIGPSVSIVKVVDKSAAYVGQPFTYTVAVTNTGDTVIAESDLVVDDPSCLLVRDDDRIGDDDDLLELGEEWRYGCTRSAASNDQYYDAGSGAIVNVVTVSGADTSLTPVAFGPLSDSTQTTLIDPSLSVTKTASAERVKSGTTVTYTYVVTNTSGVKSISSPIDITINDDKCASVTGVDANEDGVIDGDIDGDGSLGFVLISDEVFGDSEEWTYTCEQEIKEDTTNTVTVTGVDTLGNPVTPATDTASVDVIPTGISLSASVDEPVVLSGTSVVYTYVVSNTGEGPLSSVVVTDPGCSPVTVVMDGSAIDGDTNDDGKLDVDETWTYTCTGTVTADTSRSVTVSADDEFGDTVTDDDDVAVDVIAPSLSLAKSVDGVADTNANTSTGDAGDTVTYRFTLTNDGDADLIKPFTVNDPMLADGPFECGSVDTLVPNATVECTKTYVLTQADVDAGQIDNVATASAIDQLDTIVTSGSAEAQLTIEPDAALTVVKLLTGSLGDPVMAGDVLTWSITATNTGNVTLTEVSITDDTATLSECATTDLAPGESLTCTARYEVGQADVDAGVVSNTASAKGTPPGEGADPVEGSDTDTQTITSDPKIDVVKSLSPVDQTVSKVGDSLTYTVTATNTGNVTLSGVVITDASATLSACSLPATLAPGGSVACTATQSVTQADVDAGEVTNVASVKGTPPGGPADSVSDTSDEVVTPIDGAPGLEVVKSFVGFADDLLDNDRVDVGESVSWSITVTNTGNVTLSDVEVTDDTATTLVCAPVPPAMLAPGDKVTCTATSTVSQAEVDAGEVSNTAFAVGTPPGDGVDPVTGTGTDTASITPDPKIAVVKSLSPVGQTVSKVGGTLTYTVTATNIGNVVLTNVVITDATAALSGCSLPVTLTPSGSVTCTATQTVTQADVDAGEVANVASVTGTPPSGPDVSDTSNEVVTPIDQLPALTLAKSQLGSGPYVLGSVISYRITARNTGNVTLSGVRIDDDRATTISCSPVTPTTLAPNAEVECTATVEVTAADVTAGRVVNVATASGIAPDGTTDVTARSNRVETPIENPDPCSDPEASECVVTLDVIIDQTSPNPDDVGDLVTYRVVIVNTGDVTLESVTPIPENFVIVSCTPEAPATLAPGARMTCEGYHVTTAEDLAKGRIDVSVFASATSVAGEAVESGRPNVVTPTPTRTLPATGSRLTSVLTAWGFGILLCGLVLLGLVEIRRRRA